MVDSIEPYVTAVFGSGRELVLTQMAARAVVVFFVTLALIRIAGRRSFGQKGPFDSVVAILLGATISRVIVGASPFMPTIGAGLCLALLHRLFGWLSVHSSAVERFFNGRERVLIEHGVVDEAELRRALMTPRDLSEALRLQHGEDDLQMVELALLERNGQISFIRSRRHTLENPMTDKAKQHRSEQSPRAAARARKPGKRDSTPGNAGEVERPSTDQSRPK
jgi:uncharacterized membrane protein YcaP (DUF421 family)